MNDRPDEDQDDADQLHFIIGIGLGAPVRLYPLPVRVMVEFSEALRRLRRDGVATDIATDPAKNEEGAREREKDGVVSAGLGGGHTADTLNAPSDSEGRRAAPPARTPGV